MSLQNLEQISDVSKKTLKEKAVEGYDLNYTLEVDSLKKDITLLTCTGFKKMEQGDTKPAPSCNFMYIKGSEFPSGNASNGTLSEALQKHVKEVFDEIIEKVEQGQPLK